MVTYFADTAFWVALSSKRDQYHKMAVLWYRYITRSRGRIVTTEAVLWEWLNALVDASTRSLAAEGYRRAHADPNVLVQGLDVEICRAAVDLYAARPDKDWSLTDCLSFVVMQQRTLTDALTTDHHFEQAGARAVMLSNPSS